MLRFPVLLAFLILNSICFMLILMRIMMPLEKSKISPVNALYSRPVGLSKQCTCANINKANSTNVTHSSSTQKLLSNQSIEEQVHEEVLDIATPPRLLSCEDIANNITLGSSPCGKGFTKVVYRSKYHGKDVAVKMTSDQAEETAECLKSSGKEPRDCYNAANYKLMKEIMMSSQLDHPNILKVFFSITHIANPQK